MSFRGGVSTFIATINPFICHCKNTTVLNILIEHLCMSISLMMVYTIYFKQTQRKKKGPVKSF